MRYFRLFFRCIGLFALVFSGLVIAMINRLFSKRVNPSIQHFWFRSILWCSSIRKQKIDCGGSIQPPSLIVSNHLSWLDIVVIGSLFPKVVFISKHDVANWPVFGWLARLAGTLFIERGKVGASNINAQMTAILKQGYSICVFPEGRISDGSTVRRFHSRLFQAAVLANVPVQPVGLYYQSVSGRLAREIVYHGNTPMHQTLINCLKSQKIMARVALFSKLLPGLGHYSAAKQAHHYVLEWFEENCE